MGITYNCWHGCHKKSEGCLNCYVYRRDESIGKDSNIVYKTQSFDLPIRKNRDGSYKFKANTSFDMCFSSDFFIEEADEWRNDVLKMIKERNDCYFMCITKRPERIKECKEKLDEFFTKTNKLTSMDEHINALLNYYKETIKEKK